MKEKYDFKQHVLWVIQSHNGIKGRDLATAFGHSSTRQVRIAIQELRLEGEPICVGKNGGYFYSTKEKDIAKLVTDLLSRANELILVAEAVSRKNLKKESA